jgi:hypothetical protein
MKILKTILEEIKDFFVWIGELILIPWNLIVFVLMIIAWPILMMIGLWSLLLKSIWGVFEKKEDEMKEEIERLVKECMNDLKKDEIFIFPETSSIPMFPDFSDGIDEDFFTYEYFRDMGLVHYDFKNRRIVFKDSHLGKDGFCLEKKDVEEAREKEGILERYIEI